MDMYIYLSKTNSQEIARVIKNEVVTELHIHESENISLSCLTECKKAKYASIS